LALRLDSAERFVERFLGDFAWGIASRGNTFLFQISEGGSVAVIGHKCGRPFARRCWGRERVFAADFAH